ncbi:unnamed protein product [Clonostachys rosea f. rosea IK726]|uniref:Uncharacterized protein n=2 Tax=Bionectria ochroleuca TaxID=29856 RepID=A0A0B7K9X6_BIOOC|nr:unnamed protein product [Clonostachys rosea f. rosea IK726]
MERSELCISGPPIFTGSASVFEAITSKASRLPLNAGKCSTIAHRTEDVEWIAASSDRREYCSRTAAE